MFKAWKAYTFYALKFAQFVFKNCTFRFADYTSCECEKTQSFMSGSYWSEYTETDGRLKCSLSEGGGSIIRSGRSFFEGWAADCKVFCG